MTSQSESEEEVTSLAESPGQTLLLMLGTAPLHDRSDRRRASAAADRLISLSADRQRAAGDVTSALIDHHDQVRRSNGGVCRLGRFHQLLAVAATVAFHWRVADTALVCRLLRAVAECEHTLERLLAAAIFGPRVTYLVSGSKSDLEDRAECLQSAEFLLRHAADGELRITVNPDPAGRRGWERTYRAVDLPLLSYEAVPPLHAAVAQRRPDAVLLLLRLGARLQFLPVTAARWSDSRHCPLFHVCHQLNSEAEQHVLTGRPYSEEALLCLRLLLRAAPPTRLRLLTRLTPPSDQPQQSYQQFERLGPALHYTIVAQERRLAAFVGVPPLRHLSRCAVRCSLEQLGRLPGGLERLPLPDRLREYLDLADD